MTMTTHADQITPGSESSDEEFRLRLREFLAATARRLGKPPRGERERLEWERTWAATLFDHGYAGPSWPREYGGMELSFARQVIYQEEAAKARVPGVPGTGTGIAAPTIITYGTPEQKERFLGPMLRADKVWAQGYSEPEAGSDLPSLRTTARRDGDHYVVNGQKVWTSSGHLADILFTLVRTGPPDSRQEGITYLLIDAHSPGVTIRPLRDLTSGHKFSEIFFDDVKVPAANRVGEENGGWPLVRTSLGHERAAGALNQAAMYRRVLDDLIALARERGLNTQPDVRDALARFEGRVRIMRYIAMRTISDIMSRGEPGPASSVSRLVVTSFEQDLHEFAVDLLGSHGLLTGRDPHAVQRGRWLGGFLATRASTIGAGTAEIQRNTIAEKVLGLPYDPAMPGTASKKG
jgi:alkylation response protein AidB-like acyl-CoA dehydrogenase